MTMLETKRLYTPKDLLEMPDGVSYELVDGELVERHMGMESSEIAATILFLLAMFVRANRLGRVFGADASYQCFADAPRKVRKPDVSFIHAGRLPKNRTPKGHSKIAPDLAVEVVSPRDNAYNVEVKVREYIAAGVRLVWVVYPPTKTIHIFRQPGSQPGLFQMLSETDVLLGEDVLPGFSCQVREIFEDIEATQTKA